MSSNGALTDEQRAWLRRAAHRMTTMEHRITQIQHDYGRRMNACELYARKADDRSYATEQWRHDFYSTWWEMAEAIFELQSQVRRLQRDVKWMLEKMSQEDA